MGRDLHPRHTLLSPAEDAVLACSLAHVRDRRQRLPPDRDDGSGSVAALTALLVFVAAAQAAVLFLVTDALCAATAIGIPKQRTCRHRPWRRDRAAIAQRLTLVAALPESPLAAVLAIRPSRDRFDQAAHEPGKTSQTLAQDTDSLRVGEQSLAFALAGGVASFARRKKSHPACGDFIVVPCCRFARVDAQHQMKVIAHDRASIDRNGEGIGHELDMGFNPRPSVFEGLPGVAIDATEKGPSNASLDAVECARRVGWCDVRAGPGHAASVAHAGSRCCRGPAVTGVGKI